MDLGLVDRRVLVTGATDGLGKAIAAGFVAEGATVVGCGRSPDREPPTGVAATLRRDLTEPGAAEDVVASAAAAVGGIDTVVAAAGGAVHKSLADADDRTWQDGLDLNLLSIMRLIRAARPLLAERGGRVIILSALSGQEPRPNHVVSNVAKAGVMALGKTLSRELAEDGILVNCIAPGRVRSGQLDRAFTADARDAFARDHIPLGRFGEAHEVVPIALLLGSPLNTYVTGQTVTVDGGMSWGV